MKVPRIEPLDRSDLLGLLGAVMSILVTAIPRLCCNHHTLAGDIGLFIGGVCLGMVIITRQERAHRRRVAELDELEHRILDLERKLIDDSVHPL